MRKSFDTKQNKNKTSQWKTRIHIQQFGRHPTIIKSQWKLKLKMSKRVKKHNNKIKSLLSTVFIFVSSFDSITK